MKSPLVVLATIAGCMAQAAPAMAQDSPPPASESNAQDESKDSGLGLEWVWLNADVGVSYIGLDSLNSNNFQIQNTKSVGPAFGAGVGVRLLFLTVGVRARDVPLSALNLWELDGEIAMHTRIDRLDPYIGVRGGYAFDGSLSSGAVQAVQGQSPPGFSVHGWNVGPMLGCDYYFSHYFSLGLDLSAEFLFLQRDKPPLPANFNSLPAPVQMAYTNSPVYQASGTSVGFGGAAAAHLGVHF
jgi:hypothetical protein